MIFDCRCLNPGKYAQHLERWLSFYLPQQLHIIDGEQLRQNPVETLHELQRFLKITPAFNYSSHLRYDPKKGFFCQVTNEDRTKCLGKSKGRQYPPMEDRSYKLLQVNPCGKSLLFGIQDNRICLQTLRLFAEVLFVPQHGSSEITKAAWV